MTIREDILSVGPKEVRTPNMTVIAHDVDRVAKVLERRAVTELPSLCNIGGCRTTPNKEAYRPENKDSGNCGCS